ATPGVENAHAGSDAPAQDLIEEVDIDCAELVVQGHKNWPARRPAPLSIMNTVSADWPSGRTTRGRILRRLLRPSPGPRAHPRGSSAGSSRSGGGETDSPPIRAAADRCAGKSLPVRVPRSPARRTGRRLRRSD